MEIKFIVTERAKLYKHVNNRGKSWLTPIPLGYMIWDRRTAMQPALLQASKAEENSRNLIVTLREYAKKHPDLAEILRTHGML